MQFLLEREPLLAFFEVLTFLPAYPESQTIRLPGGKRSTKPKSRHFWLRFHQRIRVETGSTDISRPCRLLSSSKRALAMRLPIETLQSISPMGRRAFIACL